VNNRQRKASSVSVSAAAISTTSSNTNDALFDRKIAIAIEGLPPFFSSVLEELSQKNALTIVDYIISMRNGIDLSDHYRKLNIYTLYRISRFLNHTKTYNEFTREDIIHYLDSLRKPETSDPLHKWIGSYNTIRNVLMRFFKWLYYPDMEQKKRPKPEVIKNIPSLKRKEQSIYKPSDLWTIEDDLLFLKYCPGAREKCYHTISRDLSSRPHETTKLKIKDINFKNSGNHQYAEVLLNGKTGSRSIPLISSIPYLKDWLNQHPQSGNPNSPLICGLGKSLGKRLTAHAIYHIYLNFREKLFPKLLENPDVPPEDKQRIKELLKKPWNPYIRRHSALTEKSIILKEHVLRQHAGWSIGSQMPQKYLHYFGNESSESLLEAYGVMPKNQHKDQLKPRQCPNCSEPNKPDSKFCAKCWMVLTYDAYNETLENQQEKDSQIRALMEKQEKFEQLIQSLIDSGQLKPTIKR
jgi:integrase